MAPQDAMTPEVIQDLTSLEGELARVYRVIAERHGLAAAMQALGKLMMSPPPMPATPPAPAAAPVSTPAAAASAFVGAAAPACGSAPASPAAAVGGAAGPLELTFGRPTVAAGQSSSAYKDIRSWAATTVPASGDMERTRTLESVRSLSQIPSGLSSLVSPSMAAGSDNDSGAEDERSRPAGPAPPSNPPSTQAPAAPSLALAAAAAAAATSTAAHEAAEALPSAGAPGPAAEAAPSEVSSGVLTPLSLRDLHGGLPASAPVPVPATLVHRAGAAPREGDESSQHPSSPKSAISDKMSVSSAKGSVRSSLWQRALNAAKEKPDPWAGRKLEALAMERAIRHRYSAHTGQWTTDEVLVKMEDRPFAAGAMRECYAAKQLSTFTHSVDWHRAHNMVAKSYKKEGVHSAVYFSDTLVQMDAKMLGECYNKTDPPKQVDVMQCCILQFPNRSGAPLFCAEQLIEGDYIKYNSNSGFVKGDDLLRHTPQAFSHFTWELSHGMKICVDIQGVGDLYTDPQIHTLDGEGYGEGNLGCRGMGLFFRTHQCNDLCLRLKLKPFDRCDSDIKSQGYCSDSSTVSNGLSNNAGTLARTMMRTPSVRARAAAAAKRAKHQPSRRSEEEQLACLKDVPEEGPEALVHMEIAKLYGEVVLLPELRPLEDPQDCLRGGLFHVAMAAQLGSLMALLVLARAHLGLEPAMPQYAMLMKVGQKQGQFVPLERVAWRCTELAAQRGVRGAALALAHACATGEGPLAEAQLEGETDPAQAARWYEAALELPDLIQEAAQRAEADAIHEGEEADDSFEGSSGNASAADEDDDQVVGIMSRSGTVTKKPPAARQLGPSGLWRDLALVRPTLEGPLKNLNLPKLDELKPSPGFIQKLRLATEEEAEALPGASVPRYELLAAYGKVLMAGGKGLDPQPARALELFNEAAEAAGALGKGRLAQKYYELAAQAEGMCEE